MLEQYKEIWAIKTLVDITKTGDVRGNGKPRNQQRNFETLTQTVSILAQPWEVKPPTKDAWSSYYKPYKEAGAEFGTIHGFTQEVVADLTVWTWRFGIEHIGVFGENGILIRNQIQDTPIITGLDENCALETPVFDTNSKVHCNVLIICETLL